MTLDVDGTGTNDEQSTTFLTVPTADGTVVDGADADDASSEREQQELPTRPPATRDRRADTKPRTSRKRKTKQGSDPNDPKRVNQIVHEVTTALVALPKAKKRKAHAAPTNELTRLIPGYTAPLTLCTNQNHSTASSHNIVANLEALTRRTLHAETASAPLAVGSSHALVSFKTGRPVAHGPTIPTAGAKWFDMTSTRMTDSLRYDLAVIRNRNVLDPKRFYKKLDARQWNHKSQHGNVPLQVGTVVEGASEYYSSRLTNAQRRGNVTDEIVANGDAVYAQTKYKRLQQAKTALAAKQKGKKRNGKR